MKKYICIKSFSVEELSKGWVLGSCKVFKDQIYESRLFDDGDYLLLYDNISTGTKVYAPMDKFPSEIFIDFAEYRERKLKKILE